MNTALGRLLKNCNKLVYKLAVASPESREVKIFSAGLADKISSTNQFMVLSYQDKKMLAPRAEKVEHHTTVNGQILTDEYAWLRDPGWPESVKNPKILEYLQLENQYTEQFFTPLQDKKKEMFDELKGRIKLADQSIYVKKGEYFYYRRMEEDKDYPIYCRKFHSMEDPEEIILDVNLLAKGQEFTTVKSVVVSPNHKLLAYMVDHEGDERYSIKVLNLETQEYLPLKISNVRNNIVWHENSEGFFYHPLNEHLRNDKLMFHFLNDSGSNDKLVYQILDPLHSLTVSKSASKKYIFVEVSGHSTNEIHFIEMDDKDFQTKLIRPLKENIFYDVEHNGNHFYIRTNDNAKNFRVVIVDINSYQNDQWQNNYIPEDPEKYLSSLYITKDYLILNYRNLGLPLIKVKNLQDESEKIINFPDVSFTAVAKSTNFEENDIRIDYSSLARPKTTYSYDFINNKLSVLKIEEIPSGFDPEEYKVERIFADNEGVKVPITIMYKKALFKKDGSNPLFLYGYGSYGHGVPVGFRNTAISLVNRGFVYAMAHIRGGDDLGHDWYEAAKFLTKKRTFDDFIACAEVLIKEKYSREKNIVILGRSAGGMLIGVVINKRPELFKAAIANVPFVDTLNTMLDGSLPLTPGEFKEWGNPQDPEYFDYIKSYSPYDNVKSQDYPNLFVSAGLSDFRVSYWEAAKWVAKLRDKKTDNNILLLKTNMSTGHFGASGRFDYLKEAAEELVFIIKIFNL